MKESFCMDALGLMMASGGIAAMLFSILMLLLPLIMVLLVWRVVKWTASTTQELARLNAQMEQLVHLLPQGGMPARQPAAAFAGGDDDAFAAASMSEPSTAEGEETFDFSAYSESESDEDSFPAADAATDLTMDPDEDAGLTDEASFGGAADFDFDLESEGAKAEAEGDVFSAGFEFETAEQSFGETAEEEEPPAQERSLAEIFAAAARKEAEPFGGAFADEENAEETAEEQTDVEEPAYSEPLKPAVEEKPAILPLPADPRRPSVNLARCGQCGHKLAYKESLSGKRARCPSCQIAFVLP
jgi:hypothetical protein